MANKYLYLYTGGNPPASPEEGKAMMGEWMAYFGKLGPAVRDGGAPFAPGSHTLGGAKPSGATGYTIITADTMNAAMALTEGHPHLARGGGLEVFELAPVPGM